VSREFMKREATMPSQDHYEDRACLIGTGYIYSRSKKVCCTNYQIETFLDVSTGVPDDPNVIELLKEIRGNIKPIDIPLHSLFGKDDLTLLLEDGRMLDFFITETTAGTIIPKASFHI
jgi:hypothetical protein